MSEVTAAPAEAIAPTPTETKPGTPPTPTAPKVDPRAKLETALREMGGFEFKAGGKTHRVDSLEKLERYAQRGLPVEESLSQLAAQRAQLEPMAALLQQLQSGDEDAAESALEKLLDSGKLDKVAERRLRRQFEREQKLEGLTPRERELQAALEQERGERTKLAEERKRAEQEQAQRQEEQQVHAIKAHISGNIEKSLELMGLPAKLEPLAVKFMQPIIAASIKAGLPLDPAVLAEKVGPLFDEMLSYKAKNLDGAGLLKLLGDERGRKVLAHLRSQLESGATGGGSKPVETKTEPVKSAPWDPRRMF